MTAAHFEQAVFAAEQLRDDRRALEQSVDLRIDLRTPLFALWEKERLRHHLDAGARLASELGDQPRLARITTYQAHYWAIVAGPTGPSLEYAKRALSLAETVGVPSLTGLCLFSLGQAEHAAGNFGAAISTLERCIRLMRGDLLDERAGMALPVSLAAEIWLAFALAELGDFRDALACPDS